jgi:chromosome segregation ATPase
LRTLRQMPKLAGETEAGDPVYEVRSARLVLHGDAGHFSRLVACSRCGREVTGPPVLGPADLDHEPSAVICKDCVKIATAASDSRDDAMAPASAPVTSSPAPAGDDRVVALERRLAELAEQVGAGVRAAGAGPGEPDGAAAAQLEAQFVTLTERVDELSRGHQELAEAVRAALERLEAPAAGDGHDPDVEARVTAVEAEIGRLRDGAVQATQGEGDDRLGQRLELMAEVVRRLQADVDRSTESRIVSAADAHRLEEQLNDRLDRLAERVARPTEGPAGLLEAVDQRIDEAAGRAMQRADEVGADVARLAPEVAEVGKGLESSRRRLDVIVQELESLAESAGPDEAAAERLGALELQIVDAERRLTQAIELQREELRAGVQAELAQARSAMTDPGADTSRRLQAVERRVKANAAEMSELGELHAVLDVGLGTLRSEIAEIRQAVGRIAGEQADVQDRMEALVRVSLVGSTEEAKGRKVSRKGAGGQIAALMAAGDDLAREHQQLRAHVTQVEEELRGAMAAAARASSQASATGPLRNDIRFLLDQVAVQTDAMEAIEERLRRLESNGPAPAPAAAPAAEPPAVPPPKPARRAKKG